MEFYSNKQNFEVAAQFRDRLKNLEILLSTSFSGSSEENQELISIPTVDQFATQNDHTEGYTDTLSCKFKYEKYILKKTHLNLTTLRRIECYDVSHTGGKNIVGSMVTFINNLPAKEYYRRFKIIKQNKIDDFAALKEIFIRRLNHPEWGFSDLVIVDGGTPQVRVFQKVFSYFGIKIPLIGIAKETDILIIPFHNGFKRIALSANSPTLHLIQRIRDEAHRFAHKYHSFLRSNQFKQVEKRL